MKGGKGEGRRLKKKGLTFHASFRWETQPWERPTIIVMNPLQFLNFINFYLR
jgi:hypothetical protein